MTVKCSGLIMLTSASHCINIRKYYAFDVRYDFKFLIRSNTTLSTWSGGTKFSIGPELAAINNARRGTFDCTTIVNRRL
jgi:hypothetical protein